MTGSGMSTGQRSHQFAVNLKTVTITSMEQLTTSGNAKYSSLLHHSASLEIYCRTAYPSGQTIIHSHALPPALRPRRVPCPSSPRSPSGL